MRTVAFHLSIKLVQNQLSATLGAWLDVGFGNASLLFTAEGWGFVPVGLDLRRANVEALQRTGIEAHCRDLASLEGEARFSVISMADVLEHMPFPREGLTAARRLLAPGGILFPCVVPVWSP
jgi:protein O-GlcNAc transferase